MNEFSHFFPTLCLVLLDVWASCISDLYPLNSCKCRCPFKYNSYSVCNEAVKSVSPASDCFFGYYLVRFENVSWSSSWAKAASCLPASAALSRCSQQGNSTSQVRRGVGQERSQRCRIDRWPGISVCFRLVNRKCSFAWRAESGRVPWKRIVESVCAHFLCAPWKRVTWLLLTPHSMRFGFNLWFFLFSPWTIWSCWILSQ